MSSPHRRAGAGPRLLAPADAAALASRLPDDPFEAGVRDQLLRGFARAWCSGPLAQPEAVLVLSPWVPREPAAIGEDPSAIADLLMHVPGWDCVLWGLGRADVLAREVASRTHRATRLYEDIIYVLEGPPRPHHHPAMRPLTVKDGPAFQSASPQIRDPGGFQDLRELLAMVDAYGAVVEGRLVAVVTLSLLRDSKYAEIGAQVLEPFQGQGMAAAGCYELALRARASGRTLLWSTGEDNFRSQGVAKKVGFREHGRACYVVVPELQRSGGYRPVGPASGAAD